MFAVARSRSALAIAGVLAAAGVTKPARGATIQTVFVIAMENHNWTQPASQSSPGQIFGNPAAPFINRLVTPGNPNAAQTSYASNYLNTGTGIHPSEPNYIWAEAGSNLGVANDNDPFGTNGTNQTTTQSLSNALQNSGQSWRSYQEDIDVNLTNNQALPKSQYTVPLSSFSDVFTSGTNQYNGSNQYNYAAKHNPQVFFSSTNGGNDKTTANPLAQNYAPLQQLASDLANNTVAQYNFITPDQYNDMHTALTGGFTYLGTHYTGDQAAIAQGDNFLSQIVPMIEASQAYQNNGLIVLWWDETEGGDDASRTIPEILISPDAKGNAYTNNIKYTHSSDLLTLQEIYGIKPCLRDACNATDLSDLLKAGSLPQSTAAPDVSTLSSLLLGLGTLAFPRLLRRRKELLRKRRRQPAPQPHLTRRAMGKNPAHASILARDPACTDEKRISAGEAGSMQVRSAFLSTAVLLVLLVNASQGVGLGRSASGPSATVILAVVACAIVTFVQLSAIWREWVSLRGDPAAPRPRTFFGLLRRSPMVFVLRAGLVIGANTLVFYILGHAGGIGSR